MGIHISRQILPLFGLLAAGSLPVEAAPFAADHIRDYEGCGVLATDSKVVKVAFDQEVALLKNGRQALVQIGDLTQTYTSFVESTHQVGELPKTLVTQRDAAGSTIESVKKNVAGITATLESARAPLEVIGSESCIDTLAQMQNDGNKAIALLDNNLVAPFQKFASAVSAPILGGDVPGLVGLSEIGNGSLAVQVRSAAKLAAAPEGASTEDPSTVTGDIANEQMSASGGKNNGSGVFQVAAGRITGRDPASVATNSGTPSAGASQAKGDQAGESSTSGGGSSATNEALSSISFAQRGGLHQAMPEKTGSNSEGSKYQGLVDNLIDQSAKSTETVAVDARLASSASLADPFPSLFQLVRRAHERAQRSGRIQ